MKIYVGNMSYDTSENDLRKAFEAHGQVDSVTVITDRDTGRPKGFGFIEMSNDTEARAAMDSLNEKDFMGRMLKVNEARPRNEGQRGVNRGGYRRSF
jgi:cold-inducible RNA-binding protein